MNIVFSFRQHTGISKMADVELHFYDGPLAGLKLVGFTIWQSGNGNYNLDFPTSQYTVNGERNSFTLLRPLDGHEMANRADRLKEAIFRAFEATLQAAATVPVKTTV